MLISTVLPFAIATVTGVVLRKLDSGSFGFMNVLDAPESIRMLAESEEDTELRAWMVGLRGRDTNEA